MKGFIVYDPNFRHSINIVTPMAGISGLLIAHPSFIHELESLGIPMKYDLRGKWKDKYEDYERQSKNLFPKCNKDIIAAGMSVINPETGKPDYGLFRPIRDYVIMKRAAALELIPFCSKFPRDCELLGKYYQQMNKYAIVIGYPYWKLERSYVEFASKYGLITVLAASTAVDFSVHSQIRTNATYKQDHKTSVSLDSSKIYVGFFMSDLGLNTMQDRYYGAWDDPERGKIPVSWWMDPIVKDFAPGIVQYYYETKTPNDYFYSAHVGGRIRPSDFPDLEGYLKRGKEYLDALDLDTVAFSNHGKYDERVFEMYSEILDNVHGFFYGWACNEGNISAGDIWIIKGKVWLVTATAAAPNRDVNKTVAHIKEFIDSHPQRPLFISVLVILGNYPTVKFLEDVKSRLEKEYPGQIEFVRGDELILLIKKYKTLKS